MIYVHISIKSVTTLHPRGWTGELELPDGTTAGELPERLLALEDFAEGTPSIFAATVYMRNGIIVPRRTVLEDGDRVTIRRLMSGG